MLIKSLVKDLKLNREDLLKLVGLEEEMVTLTMTKSKAKILNLVK